MTIEDAIMWLKDMLNEPVSEAELYCAESYYGGGRMVYPDPEDYAIVEAIKALEEQDKHRWIPVNERLPEEYEKVLVCTDMKCRYVGFLNGKGKWNCIAELVNTEIDYSKVIAWMPLPEPYKENKE